MNAKKDAVFTLTGHNACGNLFIERIANMLRKEKSHEMHTEKPGYFIAMLPNRKFLCSDADIVY
jgi:hypothetical protein